MTWRVVQIRNPARLNLNDRQMVVEQEGQQATLPLEDIAVVILETPQATLTSALLSAMQDTGVAVVTCDERHTPNGVLLPFHTHSRLAEIANIQIAASQPCRKRLWQKIVQQKILNQAECLERAQRAEANPLRQMAQRVASGDGSNIEAQAARIYWQALLGNDFRRHKDDCANHALNYGYAVLRAVMARAVVAAGLLPCFGLHHSNNLNAFNLVDDLLEPMRPFCDHAVLQWRIAAPEAEKLSATMRADLAGLALAEARIGGEFHTMLNVAEKMATSLVASLRAQEAAPLMLPVFVP